MYSDILIDVTKKAKDEQGFIQSLNLLNLLDRLESSNSITKEERKIILHEASRPKDYAEISKYYSVWMTKSLEWYLEQKFNLNLDFYSDIYERLNAVHNYCNLLGVKKDDERTLRKVWMGLKSEDKVITEKITEVLDAKIAPIFFALYQQNEARISFKKHGRKNGMDTHVEEKDWLVNRVGLDYYLRECKLALCKIQNDGIKDVMYKLEVPINDVLSINSDYTVIKHANTYKLANI